jgi:hypothetical protein
MNLGERWALGWLDADAGQYLPQRTPFGIFVEGGFTYHRLTQTIAYEIDGKRGRDDLTYQPMQLFLRAGLMLVLFR